jgi:preprotein translocase subunit SecG
MILFVTLVHFIVAALLITFVLVQDSKGGGVFGMGSSSSNQVFSATGAANFLVKATRALAILFAVTCISLTYLTSKKSDSVVDDYLPATAPAGSPAAPVEGVSAPATQTESKPNSGQ